MDGPTMADLGQDKVLRWEEESALPGEKNVDSEEARTEPVGDTVGQTLIGFPGVCFDLSSLLLLYYSSLHSRNVFYYLIFNILKYLSDMHYQSLFCKILL